MLKRLLFVDDEPNLLLGLQRNLRSMRDVWDMEFASSGEEALRVFDARTVDAIVTDMRMPVMTGEELLEIVQDRSPRTIRIILSGESDQKSVLRSMASSHQFLAKPCDPDQLKTLLKRTMALADVLENDSLKHFISKMKSLPSLPLLYQEVTDELRSEDPSAAKIGEIIAQDMGMTAKILQIANSAGHSFRTEVSEPGRAVQLLGLQTVGTMVLSLSIFSMLDSRLLSSEKVSKLWERSLSISNVAVLIAKMEGIRGRDVDPYRTAGLLHNVGELVLATADPDAYRMIEKRTTSVGSLRSQVEKEIIGCDHAEIGAYILGIWGLPSSIVEAVAWHHNPSLSPITQFCPLVAVHVACAFNNELQSEDRDFKADIDVSFLERIGLSGRLDDWIERCSEQLEDGSRK